MGRMHLRSVSNRELGIHSNSMDYHDDIRIFLGFGVSPVTTWNVLHLLKGIRPIVTFYGKPR